MSQVKGSAPLWVDNYFLNYHNEGIEKHTIEKFKIMLRWLGLTDSDFTQITRGIVQEDGTFVKNSITKNQFYEAWFNIIKNDLDNQVPVVFGKHKSLKDVTTFTGSDREIFLINQALEDVFGYSAFICLLSGMMTFTEDSSESYGLRVDFTLHSNPLQLDLLNDFLGRGIHDTTTSKFSKRFFTLGTRYDFCKRVYYFSQIFNFGVRTDSQIITPTGSFFLDNYFIEFSPQNTYDYQYAGFHFLRRSYSQYTGNPKEVPKLNKMNIEGRAEIFDFLLNKLELILEKSELSDSYKTILINKLMKYVIDPTQRMDFATALKQIYFRRNTDLDDIQPLPITLDTANDIIIDVVYQELLAAFQDSSLTINTLYTWLYTGRTIAKRDTSEYYNDFDLVWSSGLGEKFMVTFKVLQDMFNMVPMGEELKIQFYARTRDGIDGLSRITGKPEGIYTNFEVHEIDVDLNRPSEAIMTMLLWMMLEPNIFSVVKWRGDNFIYLDIHNLFNQDYVMAESTENAISGSFVWTEPDGGTFTLSQYQSFMDRFKEIFEYGDIRHFLGFHNHELDSRFDNIIDYIRAKIFEHFEALRILRSDDELFDLR